MSRVNSRHARAIGAACLLLALVAVGGGALRREPAGGDALLGQVFALVHGRFVEEVSADSMYALAARGLVEELHDPYSELFSPAQLKEFAQDTYGRYAGTGMLIEDHEGVVTVMKVYDGTPAARGGVQEGDRVLAVDDEVLRGKSLSYASHKLTGPEGTPVRVRFGRPGVAAPLELTITRAVVRLPAVPFALTLDDGIAYVPLTGFSEQAAQDVAAAVKRLASAGARGVVLDLRGNPGGIVGQAVDISGLFLPRGTMVLRSHERGRPGGDQLLVTTESPSVPALPLAVLVDGGSASAAEIVAGALQDHDRAVVVGTTSYGKGVMQDVFDLDGGYAMKLTTARWFTPSGRSIQKKRGADSATRMLADTLAYRSDAGRRLTGGGGIVPDLRVTSDTLSSIEQAFLRGLGADAPHLSTALYDLARTLKPTVRPAFAVEPAWRDSLFAHLQTSGAKVTRADFDRARPLIDRLLAQRVAQVAFGDSAAFRRGVGEDRQLEAALRLLEGASSQREVLARAARQGELEVGAREAGPTG
jgi:carboxyl-terminal processing protease